MRSFKIIVALILLCIAANAASKPHVMSFGKPTTVKLLVGPSEGKSITITVRALLLDTKLKAYTTGPSHDITDRVFVVRRAYRERVSAIVTQISSKEPRYKKQLEKLGGGVSRSRLRITGLAAPTRPRHLRTAGRREALG